MLGYTSHTTGSIDTRSLVCLFVWCGRHWNTPWFVCPSLLTPLCHMYIVSPLHVSISSFLSLFLSPSIPICLLISSYLYMYIYMLCIYPPSISLFPIPYSFLHRLVVVAYYYSNTLTRVRKSSLSLWKVFNTYFHSSSIYACISAQPKRAITMLCHMLRMLSS